MTLILSERGNAMRPGVSRRAGGDKRGNAAQRRARKRRLLAYWGDGSTCPCIYCSRPLDFDSVEADRILPGGSYAFANVIPACRECNVARLNKSLWAFSPRVARRLVRMGRIVSTKTSAR
jgi:hypothetical protein